MSTAWHNELLNDERGRIAQEWKRVGSEDCLGIYCWCKVYGLEVGVYDSCILIY